VQLSLNFLISPQPATPLERLEPEQRAKLVHALARIITKAAGRTATPMNKHPAMTTPTDGGRYD
jgi:hypothetical protein